MAPAVAHPTVKRPSRVGGPPACTALLLAACFACLAVAVARELPDGAVAGQDSSGQVQPPDSSVAAGGGVRQPANGTDRPSPASNPLGRDPSTETSSPDDGTIDRSVSSVPIETRVLGGVLPVVPSTGAAAHGFLAALYYPTWRGPWFACGGTLIKPNVIITAAHCLMDDSGSTQLPGSVKLGWPNLQDSTPPPGAEIIAVKGAVIHPAFRAHPAPSTPNDLALVLLASNSRNTPAALPAVGLTLPDRQRVWGAGYSANGVHYGTFARGFFTKAFSSETCAARWEQWGKSAQYGEWTEVPPTTICTGGQGDWAGVCNGDSGGPLIYGEKAPYTLIGVLSWGTGPSPCAPGTHEINAWASLLAPDHQAWLAAELKLLGHSYPKT